MARVHRVTRSQKEHTCSKGGHVIPRGDPYLWAKPGFRRRTPLVRCVNHPFRESDLATGQNQEVLAAREQFVDTVNDLEDFDYDGLSEAVEEFQSALDDYVALREEALDAWPNGNSTLEELRDNAQYARDDFKPDVEEFSDEEPEPVDAPAEDEPDDEQSEEWAEWHGVQDAYEEYVTEHESWESDRQEHWDAARDGALDAAEGLDL